MVIFDILRKLLCIAIGPIFGDWMYTTPGSCWQLHTCKIDGCQQKREFHDFGEWKDESTRPCWQVRTCKRDGYQEWRESHSFSEWQYEAVDSCYLVRICANDGAQERKKVPHTFSEWEEKESIWDVYEHGAYGQERRTWDERKCIRCGYKEEKNLKGWWR